MGSNQRYKKTRSKKRKAVTPKSSCKKKKLDAPANADIDNHVDNNTSDKNNSDDFHNNNETLTPDSEDESNNTSDNNITDSDDDGDNGDYARECNLIINSEILMQVFSMIGHCPQCIEPINVDHCMKDKKGLAHFFDFVCLECGWKHQLCSSKKIEKPGSIGGRNFYG